jgi:putative transposase
MHMKNYRRWFVPGATYFFTLVTANREPFLCDEAARRIIREKLQECLAQWPFTLTAIVLLPDHLHTLWTLPDGDIAYPTRLGWLKKEFTKAWLLEGHPEQPISAGRQRDGLRGVWHPRYWEHTLRDDDDFEKHLDYTHYNPVKHGYVSQPCDWPWSSFKKWVARGIYPENWACGPDDIPDFTAIQDTVGEPDDTRLLGGSA